MVCVEPHTNSWPEEVWLCCVVNIGFQSPLIVNYFLLQLMTKMERIPTLRSYLRLGFNEGTVIERCFNQSANSSKNHDKLGCLGLT